ncbi:hypothetical protein E2C01_035090 [Portunus trituberculatus]|uniref:Uncharacterized protein n=1 Tax=Portunus trituberculatus TaxID=210409 RepID=A0A5B7F7I3_PORTR|nr:hypothetical protein [Portunus trituberculatus]
MARVKIKCHNKSAAAKKQLLHFLSSLNIYAVDIKEAHEGYVGITSTEEETDEICSPTCTSALSSRFLLRPAAPIESKKNYSSLQGGSSYI